MRIGDILHKTMVVADLAAPSKDEALHRLASHLCENAEIEPGTEGVHSALMNRERLGSTGVGEGVAIPHAKIAGLTDLIACFARAPDGISFDSIDQKPVRLIFVLLVPENSAGAHLKALARISRLLRDVGFRDRLLSQSSGEQIYEAFIAEDAKH